MRTYLDVAAAVFGALLSLPAQVPVAPSPVHVRPLGVSSGRVAVDQPGDGLVWARGDDWKASFGARGCTFVPFLGSQAPRNYPLALQLTGARAGAHALPLALDRSARAATPTRITIDRGPVTEVYELAPHGIEQKFVFAEPTGAGDCSVALRVATDLLATPHADGSLTFANERGGVRIGKATAVDARGATAPAATTFADGVLTYTVPAAFVAQATFPLTIDPVVLTMGLVLPPNGLLQLNPDVAYVSSFGGLHGTVIEEVFSATDHDIRIHGYDRDGVLQLVDFVDYTTTSWRLPRIASHVAASQFLCVAERGPDIAGRLVDYAAPQTIPMFVLGAQFTIHTSLLFGSFAPDVGGNPSPTATLPGNYCVTWHNGSVLRAMVRTDGVVGAASTVGLPGAVTRTNASLSKCCSPETPVQQWVLVWEQSNGADRDIHGALIAEDGTLVAADFLISGSPFTDTRPQVSSKTDFVAGADRWMVVWQRAIPGSPFAVAHDDVYGAVFQDTTNLTGETNLVPLLNRPNFANQVHPCVDTDGTRFVVGFSEKASSFGNDWAPYLATVHLTPNAQIGVTAYPELLNAYVEVDDDLQITAEHSGGTPSTRYVATWTASGIAGSSALGAFYRGHSNLPRSSYFNHALAGCGAMQIVANGLPALGETVYLDLVNAQGFPVFLVGQSAPPVALCSGCELGVDFATMMLLTQSSLVYTVPPDVTLIGAQAAVQGIDLLAPGGCPATVLGFEFTLTDEIIVTFL